MALRSFWSAVVRQRLTARARVGHGGRHTGMELERSRAASGRFLECVVVIERQTGQRASDASRQRASDPSVKELATRASKGERRERQRASDASVKGILNRDLWWSVLSSLESMTCYGYRSGLSICKKSTAQLGATHRALARFKNQKWTFQRRYNHLEKKVLQNLLKFVSQSILEVS